MKLNTLEDFKLLTLRNFSKKASSYNEGAVVQKIAAEELVSYLDHSHTTLPEGPLLEIGCGSGLVTELMTNRFADRSFEITDISPEMIASCRQALPKNPMHRFRLLDGEKFEGQQQYACIFSGCTIHWFHAWERTLQAWAQGVIPGGVLLFSFIQGSSFPEWSQVAGDLGMACSMNEMPYLADVKEVADSLGEAECWERNITVSYDKAISFFRSLKQIGATASRMEHVLTPANWKILLAALDQSQAGKFTITYKIGFCVVRIL